MKQYAELSSQHLLGHEAMDRDHQKFFEILNTVLAALDDSDLVLFGEGIKRLRQCARTHFEHEERLMRETGYDQSKAHAQAHHALISQLDAFGTAVAQGLVVPGMGSFLFLYDWLILHIAEFDTPLANHVKAIAAKEPPPRFRVA